VVVSGQQFCTDCGTSLRASVADPSPGDVAADQRAAPAELRLVSVLFCDLVGFTARSEDLDDDVVRDLLTGYFDIARAIIGRHGGTLEKFIGDAVMAVWGVPVALENDAERAVRAGLELVDAVEAYGDRLDFDGLQARVGVVTDGPRLPSSSRRGSSSVIG
jgi:class 3 adenylate cyclase